MEKEYPIKTGEVFYRDEDGNLWKATSYIINDSNEVITQNEPCDNEVITYI